MREQCHPEPQVKDLAAPAGSRGALRFFTALRMTGVWMAAAVLLLAACGGAAAPASTPAPASSAAAKPAASTAASASSAAKPAASAVAKASSGGLAKITVSHPDGGAHLPLWYAKEKGIFARNGLDVALQQLGGGAPALAALQNNQTQFADITGSVISAANAQGADMVALATLDPVYPYVLEVSADVKAPEDLRGKGIAVREFGDATDIAARVALQKLGLTPGKDVQILAFRTPDARMAAVQSKQICCTVAQPQDALELESQGFHQLLDFSKLDLLNAQGVIATQRSYLNANKPIAQALMDSVVAAIAAEKQDKPGSLELFRKYLKLDDDKVANVLYDYFVGKVIPAKPVAIPEQFADGIAVLSTQNETMKGFKVDAYIDNSFVENAAKKAAA